LSHISEEKGLKFHFVDLANEINITRPKQISRRLLKEFENNLNGIKIQVVGISYKPNIPDLRESPALNFIRELRDLGADVIWHDPLVISHGSERSQPLRTDIDIGIILVPHNTVDLAVWQKSNLKIWDLSANSTNYGWPKTL
jgi:UDP-N-acetyl-D-glucosamine dehydrogenase